MSAVPRKSSLPLLCIACARSRGLIVLTMSTASPGAPTAYDNATHAVMATSRWLDAELRPGRRVEVRAGETLVGVAATAPMALALVAMALRLCP